MKSATAKRLRASAGLTAKDIMEVEVVSVSPSSPLSEVERLLTEHRISGMPVVDASGRAIGVVSYRDLLDHHAARTAPSTEPAYFHQPMGRLFDEDLESVCVERPGAGTVEDVMTPAIVDVATDASIQEICRTMAKHAVHRVLVTEPGSGRMVGIVSSLGVLAAIAGE